MARRFGSLRSDFNRCVTLTVLSVTLLHWQVQVHAEQIAGPTAFGDDKHTAKSPDIKLITNGSAGLIDTATTAFKNAVNAASALVQWNFVWNTSATITWANVQKGINVIDYKPWVVTAPTVTASNGDVYAPAADKSNGPGELGGAVINLSYTPVNGAPVLQGANSTMEWIQAYSGQIYGNNFGPILDNNPNGPYQSQVNTGNPWYGPNGPYAGYDYVKDTNKADLAHPENNTYSYFVDRPQVPELIFAGMPNAGTEYEKNPIVTSTFQVILATDSVTVSDKGVTTHTVTMYGGEEWGFTYSAVDVVPEPSSLALLTLGGIASALGAYHRRRAAA